MPEHIKLDDFGDWYVTNRYLHFLQYITCQRFFFSFLGYRSNNPLRDQYIDMIDNITPSGV